MAVSGEDKKLIRLITITPNEKTLFQELFQPAVIVGGLGYFVDIYDLSLFMNVREQSLNDLGLGWIIKNGDWYHDLMSWQMTGMLIGGIVFGVFGDRMGRKATLFGSILLYSIANLANSFVDSFIPYAIWRFIAGVGLAGELGGCISLVAETLSKERRGYGTALVATIGVFGAVVGGILAEIVTWRTNFRIGGGMGICLLILRSGVKESFMFHNAKLADDSNVSVSRGNFFALFTDIEKLIRYAYCIMMGLPTWFMIGILVQRCSSHFAPQFGIVGEIHTNRSVAIFYFGMTFGDLVSGLLSQYLKSRKKAVTVFISFSLFFVLIYLLFMRGASNTTMYFIISMMGFGNGFWTVFVTISAENFGTNLRATVATTVPNFSRGSLVPITGIFTTLTPAHFSPTTSALILTVLIYGLCYLSLWKIEETFGKDLDFLEIQTSSASKKKITKTEQQELIVIPAPKVVNV